MDYFIYTLWIGGACDVFSDLRSKKKYSIVLCVIGAAIWPLDLGAYIWKKIKPDIGFLEAAKDKYKLS